MNIFITDFGPERREKTLYLRSLVSGLADLSGVNLHLACLEGSILAQLGARHRLPVVLCKSGRVSELLSRLKLQWRMRKQDTPWLVQSFDERSFALAIQVAHKKPHINLVYSALRPEAITSKAILDNLHLVSAATAETKEIAETLASSGFLPSSTFVIPGCVEAGHYQTREARNDGRVLFACSDPLENDRGYDQLFQALAYLYGYENMPVWEMRLAADGPMFDELIEKARELHVDSRLAVFGGFDAPEILRGCDIMVAPGGSNEGGSLTIKEAWAAGLPVLCSDSSAQRELVEDGKNGLIYENHNAADLAEKMYSLATNPVLCSTLADQGQASLENYTCDKLLRRNLGLYQRILGEEERLGQLDI